METETSSSAGIAGAVALTLLGCFMFWLFVLYEPEWKVAKRVEEREWVRHCVKNGGFVQEVEGALGPELFCTHRHEVIDSRDKAD